jgi:hypothetical protein
MTDAAISGLWENMEKAGLYRFEQRLNLRRFESILQATQQHLKNRLSTVGPLVQPISKRTATLAQEPDAFIYRLPLLCSCAKAIAQTRLIECRLDFAAPTMDAVFHFIPSMIISSVDEIFALDIRRSDYQIRRGFEGVTVRKRNESSAGHV